MPKRWWGRPDPHPITGALRLAARGAVIGTMSTKSRQKAFSGRGIGEITPYLWVHPDEER